MVTFRGLVVPVLVLVIFVGGGLAAYSVADLGQRSAAHDDGTIVTNESHIQQVGMWQLTDNSTAQFWAGSKDTVTVWNNSSPRGELVEGDDYEWNESDGALFLKDTDNTTDGEQYLITYTYYRNTDDVQELAGPLGTITEGLGQFAFFGAGIALVVFLLGFGAIISKYLGSRRNRPRTRR